MGDADPRTRLRMTCCACEMRFLRIDNVSGDRPQLSEDAMVAWVGANLARGTSGSWQVRHPTKAANFGMRQRAAATRVWRTCPQAASATVATVYAGVVLSDMVRAELLLASAV